MAIDLIGASYSNIGPFQKKININFKFGNYLIKSPIGKGKSFLFFDCPLFGLYKTSDRQILNMKSTKGFVEILFELDGIYYLIERRLTAKKSGTISTQSKLYTVSETGIKKVGVLYKNILNKDQKELSKLLKGYIEEINFKSQNELQATLNALLPEKEVFTNTNFLVQDSNNIFEMTPQNRINVFKNIFGLMNLDEIKDKIALNKKENAMKIKLKKGDVSIQTKFETLLSNVLENSRNIKNKKLKKIIDNNDFFFDMNSFEGKISVVDLEKDKYNFENINSGVNDLFLEIQNFDNKEKELNDLNSEKENIEKNINEYISNININEKKVEEWNKNKNNNIELELKRKTNNKQLLEKELNTINSEVDYETLKKYNITFTEIVDVKNIIEKSINTGKEINENLKTTNNFYSLLEKENTGLQEKLDNLNKQGNEYKQRLEKYIKTQKENFEKEIKELEDELNKLKVSKEVEEKKYIKKDDINSIYFENILSTSKSNAYILKDVIIRKLEQEKNDIEIKIKNNIEQEKKSIGQRKEIEIELDQKVENTLKKINENISNSIYSKIKTDVIDFIEGKISNIDIKELKNEKKELETSVHTVDEKILNNKKDLEQYNGLIKKIEEKTNKNIPNILEQIKNIQNINIIDRNLSDILVLNKDIENKNSVVKENIKNFSKMIEEKEKSINSLKENIDIFKTNDFDKIKTLVNLDDFEKSINVEIEGLKNEKKELLDNINKTKTEIKEKEERIEKMRKFFKDFSLQTFNEIYQKYEEKRDEYKKSEEEFNKVLDLFNKEQKIKEEIEGIKTEITKNKTLKDIEEKKIKDITKQLILLQKSLENKEENFNNKRDLEIVKEILDQLSKIFVLAESRRNDMIEIKELEEKEKILNNLYNTFNKEIILLVIEKYLPSLEEAINVFLGTAVDFEVKFKIEPNKSDRLELEIEIKDSKGNRNVKSLSGGQKIMLKIAWILAVSKILRAKFLFLDETVNNLDVDTISNLAGILENFTKKNDIKFYLVTHSPEIQNLDFWNENISVEI